MKDERGEGDEVFLDDYENPTANWPDFPVVVTGKIASEMLVPPKDDKSKEK